MITNPQLPPKAGYVEVEINGQRTYRKITRPGDYADEQVPVLLSLQQDADEFMVDHEYRLTLLELGVNEDVV